MGRNRAFDPEAAAWPKSEMEQRSNNAQQHSLHVENWMRSGKCATRIRLTRNLLARFCTWFSHGT
jgi:hypothetical protein